MPLRYLVVQGPPAACGQLRKEPGFSISFKETNFKVAYWVPLERGKYQNLKHEEGKGVVHRYFELSF